MDIGEIIGTPAVHKTDNEKCPFCPKEPPPVFTTHPGSANDSAVLEAVMEKPDVLVSRQAAARPKKGEKDQQSTSQTQAKPNPIHHDATEGDYSCEAHHLISGKQALDGRAFERWIVAGDTIEKDTGYSVNNADNGLWAPSIPEKYKGGKWGPMTFEKKLAIAKKPMQAGKPQFHKGHHAIGDPDDPDGLKHRTYDGYLKQILDAMDKRMTGWANKCFLCDNGKKAKFQPSVRVNQVLDNLSKHMRGKISGAPATWDVFISKYAREVHKPVCPHGVRSE